jgi:hypothetical protein
MEDKGLKYLSKGDSIKTASVFLNNTNKGCMCMQPGLNSTSFTKFHQDKLKLHFNDCNIL